MYSGTVVRRGEASAVIVGTGARTFFGRTTELVETAHPKLHVEEVISRVVRWLFLIVGVLVAAAVVVSVAHGGRLVEILPLSLVLLMSAVPIALPVMFTVTMAVGSVALARKGALVTRLSAAEDAATLDVLCADKTGTLTANKLTLVRALPQPGFDDADVVRDGAFASNDADRDPIDVAFLDARAQPAGCAARSRSRSSPSRPTPGAPRRRSRSPAAACASSRARCGPSRGSAGSSAAPLEAQAAEAASGGERVLAVARARRRTAGAGGPRAPLRPAAARLAPAHRRAALARRGGEDADRRRAAGGAEGRAPARPRRRHPRARALAARAPPRSPRPHDGFAEVFPEDKYLVVERLQAAGHVVGMTGDGVNDSPALRQAEVGIAVSGATDVAKGAASVVLTREGLGGIVDLVDNGRAIYSACSPGSSTR